MDTRGGHISGMRLDFSGRQGRRNAALTIGALGGAAVVAGTLIGLAGKASAQPPNGGNGNGAGPAASKGVYVPVYSPSMTDMLEDIRNTFPRLPLWGNYNPNSGPGDEYTGDFSAITRIQDRIDRMQGKPNTILSGYTGTWYAGALSNPPEGSTWNGPHFGVVYTQSETQYNNIISSGGDAILLQDVVDKYAGAWYTGLNGLMCDEVYSGSNTAKQNWYKQLIDYARSQGLLHVRGNPGAEAPFRYFEDGWFDSISIFEGGSLPSISQLDTRTGGGVHAQKCSFVAHGTQEPSRQAIYDRLQYVKYMYVTDDPGPPNNPYDTPSSYYLTLAQYIDDYNEETGAYS